MIPADILGTLRCVAGKSTVPKPGKTDHAALLMRFCRAQPVQSHMAEHAAHSPMRL